jgi:hypothetical protein
MNTKRTSGPNCAKTVPTQYEVVDCRGDIHGPFHNAIEAFAYADAKWPDQEQDEDRTGNGWDVQVVGCEP